MDLVVKLEWLRSTCWDSATEENRVCASQLSVSGGRSTRRRSSLRRGWAALQLRSGGT